MIYKLLNKLFGWDYVIWSYSGDHGIARVQVDGMRRVWRWHFKPTRWYEFIEDPTEVIWLTCSPNKYFPPSLPKSANVDVLTALKRAHKFIADITDSLGPYEYVNGTGLVYDAWKESSALREVIEQLEGVK